VSGGKFELYRDREGSYRFRLKAANGAVMAESVAYENQVSASSGIRNVLKSASYLHQFTMHVGDDLKYYFQLVADSGEPLLHSQGYSTHASAASGIEAIKRAVHNAKIENMD